MLHDLLYVNEHITCGHYVSDYRCCFRYAGLSAEDRLDVNSGEGNYILFVVDGSLRISCNEYLNRVFEKGTIVYLPKSAVIDIQAREESQVLYCLFEVPHNVCDKLNFHSFKSLCEQMTYDFEPTVIRPQMQTFVDTLIYYLRNGINCEHFHELKQNEMFLIFRWFYPKEELASFFHPMIGNSLDFKAVVLGNYTKVDNVSDLAKIVHMSRSSFDAAFKDEFGMPPRQWMLKQKANHIRYDLSEPNATIGDVIFKYGFNSATHFTRFCKQQFGSTPTELIASLRKS